MLRSRWVAAPLSLLVWASFVLIVIAWTPLVGLYRLVTLRSDPDRYRLGRVFRRSAVLAARLNPFWTFRVLDAVHPDPRRPYVFVANHSSFADVFLLALLPWEMKWLSKRSIMRIPLLGWQMRMAGDIPITRGDRESARHAMAELRRRLDRRLSVFFFPEGTRSEGDSLGPFREGAFRLAIEAGVDVVPLVLAGTGRGLPKHSIVFEPAEASLTVLEPVSTAGLTPAEAPALAQRVRERMVQALGAPPSPSGRGAG